MTDKNPHRKMGIFCAIVESLDKTSDMKVLPNLELSDFDQESVKSYRVWFATRHPDHAWTKLPDGEFLEMIGAADWFGMYLIFYSGFQEAAPAAESSV